jgi:hypothetical protein
MTSFKTRDLSYMRVWRSKPLYTVDNHFLHLRQDYLPFTPVLENSVLHPPCKTSRVHL